MRTPITFADAAAQHLRAQAWRRAARRLRNDTACTSASGEPCWGSFKHRSRWCAACGCRQHYHHLVVVASGTIRHTSVRMYRAARREGLIP